MADPRAVLSQLGLTELTGFDRLYGLELDAASPEEMQAHVDVTDAHKQPFGLVHGGLYAAIAESLCSIGTVIGVQGPAAGMSNHTSFLRPITGGTIHAVARSRHRGRTTWVWDTDITDDDGRLCAVVRVTTAVLSAQPR